MMVQGGQTSSGCRNKNLKTSQKAKKFVNNKSLHFNKFFDSLRYFNVVKIFAKKDVNKTKEILVIFIAPKSSIVFLRNKKQKKAYQDIPKETLGDENLWGASQRIDA